MKYVYLSKRFARQARRAQLDDGALIHAIDRADEGSVDAISEAV